MKIELKSATLDNILDIQSLVNKEVNSGVLLARSDDEIATNIRSYILAYNENSLVGLCALHIHTKELAEIRSLIVDEKNRGYGVGEALVLKSLQDAKELGVKRVLCLTYQDQFFIKLGFTPIPKETIPEHKIWADCIKCKHFPICNEVSLIKNI